MKKSRKMENVGDSVLTEGDAKELAAETACKNVRDSQLSVAVVSACSIKIHHPATSERRNAPC